jgi:hypothetical protein
MTKRIMNELDETICKLESMGTILTQLATDEGQPPERTSLADLGRVIQFLAMEALDLKIKIEKKIKKNSKRACN